MLPAGRMVVLTSSLIVCAIASAEPRTINDAIYSEAQAETGEQLYKEHCLTCHDKKYFRPVLKAWDGRSLEVFFTVMSASMPESNPGSLLEKESVDILAYILSLGRYPVGDTELDYKDGALNEITIANRKQAREN
jgi:cytochrome c